MLEAPEQQRRRRRSRCCRRTQVATRAPSASAASAARRQVSALTSTADALLANRASSDGRPQVSIPPAGRRTSSAVYSKNSWVWGERPSQPARPGSCCQPDWNGVVGEVHFVVAGHVLAEDEGELVGELLGVGSAHAEDSDSEVLGADRAFRKFLVAHGADAFWSACWNWCSSGRAACCSRPTQPPP